MRICIPGDAHPHSRWGCAFPVRINHNGINILTGNEDVTHRECTSSPGMGMCLTGSAHSLYRVKVYRAASFSKTVVANKLTQTHWGPIYTIANTQRIRIYPGKLEFSLDKISSDSKCLHSKGTKDNQTLVTFVRSGNVSGRPCSDECQYGAYQNLFNYAVNLPR